MHRQVQSERRVRVGNGIATVDTNTNALGMEDRAPLQSQNQTDTRARTKKAHAATASHGGSFAAADPPQSVINLGLLLNLATRFGISTLVPGARARVWSTGGAHAGSWLDCMPVCAARRAVPSQFRLALAMRLGLVLSVGGGWVAEVPARGWMERVFFEFCSYIHHTRPDPITKRISAIPNYDIGGASGPTRKPRTKQPRQNEINQKQSK